VSKVESVGVAAIFDPDSGGRERGEKHRQNNNTEGKERREWRQQEKRKGAPKRQKL